MERAIQSRGGIDAGPAAVRCGCGTPDLRAGDAAFDEYPQESLADWHRRHGLAGD